MVLITTVCVILFHVFHFYQVLIEYGRIVGRAGSSSAVDARTAIIGLT